MQRIHSTNTDNNLVEINEEMSELLDKQLWQEMNKGLTAKSGREPEVCDENKEKEKEKKRLRVEKNFNDRSDFFRMLNNSTSTDEDETNNNEST